MNVRVRTVLDQQLRAHGPELLQQPHRLSGLLRDLCPEDEREVTVLLVALDHGIPATLRSKPHGQTELNTLARALAERAAIAMRWAIWAVESWAVVLQVRAGQVQRRVQSRVRERPGTLAEVLDG